MRRALHDAARPVAAVSQKASIDSGGIPRPARSWRSPNSNSNAAAPATQPAATHMDPRATRRGRTGVRSPASSSIRSSIDASFISFAFNQFGELLEPAMDIHFDERLALPANLRRIADRSAFDLAPRDRERKRRM